MKKMGFNAVRKHMKVDTRRWFYHADRLGFLVWQDIPAWSGNEGDAEDILFPEVRNIWKGIRSSPALIQWEAFNEVRVLSVALPPPPHLYNRVLLHTYPLPTRLSCH